MTRSLRRQLAVAAGTVAVATVLWNAALPDQKQLTPEGRQQERHRQYGQVERRTREEQRAAGERLGEAVHRDQLRPGEVRRPNREADDIARRILRRVP